jgi:hypothetical protein
MPDTVTRPDDAEGRFEEAVAEFLLRREAGEAPSPQRFLERFPDLAPRLDEFFAGLALFDGLAADLDGLRGRTSGPWEWAAEVPARPPANRRRQSGAPRAGAGPSSRLREERGPVPGAAAPEGRPGARRGGSRPAAAP